MSIVNDKWHVALGEAVNRIAETELSYLEKGKAIEFIYKRFEAEDERDSRELFNGKWQSREQQGVSK